MKPLILSFLLAAGIATAAHAQISAGGEVGILMSNYTGKSGGATVPTTAVVGFKAGTIFNICLANSNFYLQPGIAYVLNGYKEAQVGETVTTSVNTVEIPLNLLYKFGHGNNGFFIGLGVYAGYNFAGSYTESGFISNSANLTFGSTAGTDDMKAFDFGLGASLGYGVSRGFFACLHFQQGLLNLTPGGNAQNTISNMNYGLSVGYLFGGGARKRWGY